MSKYLAELIGRLKDTRQDILDAFTLVEQDMNSVNSLIQVNEDDIENKLQEHKNSTTAHNDDSITNTSNVTGAKVKDAMNQLKSQVDSIVVSGTMVSQALVDSENEIHTTLKDRNDKWEQRTKDLESEVLENDFLAKVLIQEVMQHKRLLADLEGEIGEVTLTNSQEYPFNNSEQTVSLSKARDTLNYRVDVEIVSVVGFPGKIEVYDKQLNGFKVKFTGSASSVTVKYIVQGGMYQ